MSENRTFSGRFNNLQQPNWGRAGERLLRLTTPSFVGGSGPSGPSRPNPRKVSNIVCRQDDPNADIPSKDKFSHFMWAWGQFLDHELDITDTQSEDLSFQAPPDDPDLPGATINFNRSIFDLSTGTGADNPRQQITNLSSYIDGANIYGADGNRAGVLRLKDGSGKLKTSKPKPGSAEKGDLLPRNTFGLPNAEQQPVPPDEFFVSGDVRVNEHTVLTCMHTLWLREHNCQCDMLAKDGNFKEELEGLNPGERDEAIYQRARKIVGAEMQAITFEEFLPALLGKNALSPYSGYKTTVNASISNIFSTACYRLGHTMLPADIPVITKRGRTTRVRLRDLFFTPSRVEEHGLDNIFRGLVSERQQEIDHLIAEDVRTFLFRVFPEQKDRLLDLAALNIQRGRDHGLPDYNQCREDFGLARKTAFSQISSDSEANSRLEAAYEGNIDNIDPWLGSIAEAHVPGAAVGELLLVVLKDQFERARDGDRFWYENDPCFDNKAVKDLKKTRLSDIIKRNTGFHDVPKDVFRAK